MINFVGIRESENHHCKMSVARRGSDIETSVLSYGGTITLIDATGIATGLSLMLAWKVCLEKETISNRTRPMDC